ncbi:MAG: biopolymer transporter ExbD [Pelagibacterales bacterium]|nr:biopolymer transporter ExbD [Pelagibacterales bacterium]
MGANLGSNRGNKKRRVISDINITPFVDVLLVLLIIFMIAAPMMTSGVDVTLPKGAGEPNDDKIHPIAVSIKPDGSIFIEEESVKLSSLSSKLMEITKNDLNSKIYVQADQTLDYGRVMDVVKTINLGGFSQVILVTELVQ